MENTVLIYGVGAYLLFPLLTCLIFTPVISSGCNTPPNVPFANIDAFYKAVNDFNLS